MSVRNLGDRPAKNVVVVVGRPAGIQLGQATGKWRCLNVGLSSTAGTAVCAHQGVVPAKTTSPRALLEYQVADSVPAGHAPTFVAWSSESIEGPQRSTAAPTASVAIGGKLEADAGKPFSLTARSAAGLGSRPSIGVLKGRAIHGIGGRAHWSQLCTTAASVAEHGDLCTTTAPPVTWISRRNPTGLGAKFRLPPRIKPGAVLHFKLAVVFGGEKASDTVAVTVSPNSFVSVREVAEANQAAAPARTAPPTPRGAPTDRVAISPRRTPGQQRGVQSGSTTGGAATTPAQPTTPGTPTSPARPTHPATPTPTPTPAPTPPPAPQPQPAPQAKPPPKPASKPGGAGPLKASINGGAATVDVSGGRTTLSSSVSGGTGPYTYKWSGSGGPAALGDPSSSHVTTTGATSSQTISLSVTDAAGQVDLEQRVSRAHTRANLATRRVVQVARRSR